jgi:tRNA G18 (ribose-2'-O)-methylase SpoU
VTFHYLESASDPRVSDYTTLTDVHLRKLREPREGMYIAESSRVLRRALAAGNPDRLALVLGTEGAGMSPETLAAVDLAVKIPMRNGVDSLNVAAASAVAFWELRPRR